MQRLFINCAYKLTNYIKDEINKNPFIWKIIMREREKRKRGFTFLKSTGPLQTIYGTWISYIPWNFQLYSIKIINWQAIDGCLIHNLVNWQS